MPIRPENKSRYPSNWKEIRKKILDRAKNKCENCGVKNYLIGYRDDKGEFIQCDFRETSKKVFKIILTVAHLDHIPENCSLDNLRAWCQKCHNSYDAPTRARNRKKNKNPGP